MAKQIQKDSEVVNEAPVHKSSYSTADNRTWLYVVGGIVVLALFFMMGASVASHRNPVYGQPKMLNVRTGGGFGVERGERHFSTGGQFDNGQTRTQGVVTIVNGNDFTIAGQGSTTNITTNNSTKYQNGNAVKQNDSVIVFGTISNNTVTATEIIINP